MKPKTFANPAEPQEFEYSSHRSHAIAYLFIHIYGAPTEDNWYCERPSVVTEIMNTLSIPEGSSACVKRVLRDVLENGSRYDPKCHLCERGRQALIVEFDPTAYVIYNALASDLTITEITVLVNEDRSARNLESVSWSTVQRFIQNSRCCKFAAPDIYDARNTILTTSLQQYLTEHGDPEILLEEEEADIDEDEIVDDEEDMDVEEEE